MKKLVLAVLFVLTVLPAFAQDAPPVGDEYAKFQGVWYGVYSNEIFIFVFIDDTFVSTLEACFTGKFFIEKENIVFQAERRLSLLPGWEKIEDTDNKSTWQYVFSGENLVLVDHGDALVLSRNSNLYQ
jgi:hypothetical protein